MHYPNLFFLDRHLRARVGIEEAKRVAYLECEKHLGCSRQRDDGNPLLRQKRGEDSGLLSRHVVPTNRAAWLGHI